MDYPSLLDVGESYGVPVILQSLLLPLFRPANLQCYLFFPWSQGVLALPALASSDATPHCWAAYGKSSSGEFLVRFKGWCDLGMRGGNRRWDTRPEGAVLLESSKSHSLRVCSAPSKGPWRKHPQSSLVKTVVCGWNEVFPTALTAAGGCASPTVIVFLPYASPTVRHPVQC